MELRLADGLPKDRIDKILARELPEHTRETLKRWILEGRVRLAGKPLRPKDRVGGGALIQIDPGSALLSEAIPDETVRFSVTYEDDSLLVINKPAGLVVHPARGNRTGTLVHGLLARPDFSCPPADPRDPEGHLRPGIVHRLDRDTSGLLVVAKSEAAREGLKRQLERHQVKRRYDALTWGIPASGRIESLHGRDPRNRLRFSAAVQEGKRAVTQVELVESLAGGRVGWVQCRLETGRTHQIRVHLSQVRGTPLLADPLYGGMRSADDVLRVEQELGRHALHAAELGFVHPITGEEMLFEEPLPADLQQALVRLRELRSQATTK